MIFEMACACLGHIFRSLSLSVPVFITDVFHASSADQNIVAAVRDGGD